MQQNKMAVTPMGRLIWRMGLPMIVSMVLQALYNVVDSVFVSNMGPAGAMANHALTLAFPIQILMIAVGVGTGVGINALLSRSLGQGDRDKVNRVAGTAWATVIGQFVSLFAAMALHYTSNREIDGHPRYIRPNWALTREIYGIGISAALMLALLRLVVFVFPLAWAFSRTEQVLTLVWWTFPIAEVLTAAVAAIFLRRAVRNKLRPMVSGQYKDRRPALQGG